MQLFVQGGGAHVVALTCTPSDLIGSLKVAALGPDASAGIRLAHGGVHLREENRVEDYPIRNYATLQVQVPFRGGGGDGGATGAESRSCYLEMYMDKKPDKVDPNEARVAKWTRCRLSGELLNAPCAMDMLGNLYNKEAVVHHLVLKKIPASLSHIKSLKDIFEIHLTENPAADQKSESATNRFQCPITGQEFNGLNRFYALKSCGHVLSARAFKEVKSTTCLVCHKGFVEEDKVVINGTEEEVADLKKKMEQARALSKQAKKDKRSSKVASAAHEDGRSISPEESSAPSEAAANGVKRKGPPTNGSLPAGMSAPAAAAAGLAVNPRPKGSDLVSQRKRFKAVEELKPKHADRSVYASIFTSSSRDAKETYMCRSLPLGRN
ncbi:Rtf2 domain containing protein [Klebsormidium nitens]|uniref:Rtf2 domain containing protein n=1 Tax=Klebsormidium nitens TaxID=105231 RepID=A0A1Y1I4U6_KLENI|nr:Rtf2 domain containing protein [Klebsormidium nitens]|eukprot:GAQ83726.1 Rtf2 domain containing protein [Klebsormidium nitens]